MRVAWGYTWLWFLLGSARDAAGLHLLLLGGRARGLSVWRKCWAVRMASLLLLLVYLHFLSHFNRLHFACLTLLRDGVRPWLNRERLLDGIWPLFELEWWHFGFLVNDRLFERLLSLKHFGFAFLLRLTWLLFRATLLKHERRWRLCSPLLSIWHGWIVVTRSDFLLDLVRNLLRYQFVILLR